MTMSNDADKDNSLRQRSTGSTSPSEGVEPIDEEAQERVVRTLEQDQAAQESASRKSLTFVLLIVILLHFYLTLKQAFQPWSNKQSAYFIGLNANLVMLGYAMSSAAYGLILSRLKSGSAWHQTLLSTVAPAAGAALTFVFWASMLSYTVYSRQEGWQPALKYWWLPFGPVALLCLVEYTFSMFASSRTDIQKLRTKMYSCKTA